MKRCLELARLGAGRVAPNPMVGAVLVYQNNIIGEGFHRRYGQAHAEVDCINSVQAEHRQLIEASTLYVSLEPCSHYGKTPPCTDLIITNQIPRVVIGCRDTNESVHGKGIEKLAGAGIKVITGILENDCRQLNRRFFTFHEIKRPYVILKWAQSGDGKIAGAGNERLFISNAYTNRLVHKWRTEEDAILVGKSTALQDNPALTARLWPGKNPLRLVIDKNLELPGSLSLFDREAKTIVFNFLKQINEGNIQYYQLNKTRQLPEQIVDSLYKMQLLSVIIEGGAKTLQSFIEAGFWDEARVITNTSIRTGFGLAAPVLKANSLLAEQIINDDHIQYYQNSQVNRNTA